MNKDLQKFCQFLQQAIFCEQKLSAWKLSARKIQDAFYSLDYARRGSISVSDLFRHFPDFSQEDLFSVFKALDFTRSGKITVEDLLETICCSEEDQSDRDPLAAFKFCIKIIQMNYQELEKKKAELGIETNFLSRIFQIICGHKQNIQAKDLISLVEQYSQTKITKTASSFITDVIFHKQPIGAKQFVEIFKPFKWSEIPRIEQVFSGPSHQNQNRDPRVNLADISSVNLQKLYRPQSPQMNCHISPVRSPELGFRHQDYYLEKNNSDNLLKKVSSVDNISSKLFQRTGYPLQQRQKSPLTNNWMEQEKLLENIRQKYHVDEAQISKNIQARGQASQLVPSECESKWNTQITSSISSNMAYIEKRRQELKKCSRERQEIMDNIMAKRGNSNSRITDHSRNAQNSYLQRPKSGYTSENFYAAKNQRFQPKITQEQRMPRMSQEIKDLREDQNQYAYHYDKLKQPFPQSTFSGKSYLGEKNLMNERNLGRQLGYSYSNSYLSRPASAQKSALSSNSYFKSPQNTDFSKNNYFRKDFSDMNKNSRLLLNQSLKTSDPMKNFSINKENILRRAEQEASRKIEQIERKARMKVMEKRSGMGLYNQWLK